MASHGRIGISRRLLPPGKAACRTSWKSWRSPEVFDNGLGRAMWFASGARAELVIRTLAGFPRERHAALWSGVGLATTYAGGASLSELQALLSAAGGHRNEVALGAAIAAKAGSGRERDRERGPGVRCFLPNGCEVRSRRDGSMSGTAWAPPSFRVLCRVA